MKDIVNLCLNKNQTAGVKEVGRFFQKYDQTETSSNWKSLLSYHVSDWDNFSYEKIYYVYNNEKIIRNKVFGKKYHNLLSYLTNSKSSPYEGIVNIVDELEMIIEQGNVPENDLSQMVQSLSSRYGFAAQARTTAYPSLRNILSEAVPQMNVWQEDPTIDEVSENDE